jgi:hypothetical protein
VSRKATGSPSPFANRWILVVSPPRERPRALSSEPFFAARGRLLVSPHDRRVQHQVRVLRVRNQIVEDPIPYANPRPPCKTLVHALVLAIALWQVFPAHARTHHPQHSHSRTAGCPPPDDPPCQHDQEATARSDATAPHSTRNAKIPSTHCNKLAPSAEVNRSIPPSEAVRVSECVSPLVWSRLALCSALD